MLEDFLFRMKLFLCKWWWRYGGENDAIWVKAINSKYGVTSSKWLPSQLNNQNSFSKIWGDICQVRKEGANLEMIIAEGFWIKVGSGQQTSFWKDVWCP